MRKHDPFSGDRVLFAHMYKSKVPIKKAAVRDSLTEVRTLRRNPTEEDGKLLIERIRITRFSSSYTSSAGDKRTLHLCLMSLAMI